MGTSGKGSQQIQPPQVDTGAQMMQAFLPMMGGMMEAMGAMAAMGAMPKVPEAPKVPNPPKVKKTPKIDWKAKDDELKAKARVGYGAKKKGHGRRDTIVPSLLDEDSKPKKNILG